MYLSVEVWFVIPLWVWVWEGGGGGEVGKIVVELLSGKPAGEQYNSEDSCSSDMNMKFMILTNHCSY